MEFYTGIHEPQVMEDLIDEEIEHGPVIDDVEDTEDYQETMEVIEEETGILRRRKPPEVRVLALLMFIELGFFFSRYVLWFQIQANYIWVILFYNPLWVYFHEQLYYPCSSPEEKNATMSTLKHRLFPPQFHCKWPKEAFFSMRLLHPNPASRPGINEVLESEFLNEPKEKLDEREAAIELEEKILEQEMLLEFLLELQQRKQEDSNYLLSLKIIYKSMKIY
ncbi:hypothetical protein LXL04_001761 [Taraxacum kok-saghyz]